MVALAQGTGWDPDVLARIRVLELRARDLVQGYLHGAHLSGRATSNVEFADYKEYSPGDPLRDLDWRVMGRSDRLVVRRHHAENELATTILLDASGDMATGAAGGQPSAARPPLKGSKWGSAAVLCATLAYWLQRHGEPVGLMVLGGQDVRWPYLPPRIGEAQLARILGVIAQTRPSGRADLAAGLRAAGQRMGRRQLMVLVSDLMEEPSEWGPSVATLLRRRIDLRVVHLHDSREWAMTLDEPGLFRSPEGGDAIPEDPDEIRAAFSEEVQRYLAEVRSSLSAVRGAHVLAPTDQPLDRVIARLLRGM